MKKDIHPEYGAATIRCGCGNSWETRATQPELRIEVCSECHPFFTGEQRIVDTAGRVERYRRRFGLQDGTPATGGSEEAPEDAEAADGSVGEEEAVTAAVSEEAKT